MIKNIKRVRAARKTWAKNYMKKLSTNLTKTSKNNVKLSHNILDKLFNQNSKLETVKINETTKNVNYNAAYNQRHYKQLKQYKNILQKAAENKTKYQYINNKRYSHKGAVRKVQRSILAKLTIRNNKANNTVLTSDMSKKYKTLTITEKIEVQRRLLLSKDGSLEKYIEDVLNERNFKTKTDKNVKPQLSAADIAEIIF